MPRIIFVLLFGIALAEAVVIFNFTRPQEKQLSIDHGTLNQPSVMLYEISGTGKPRPLSAVDRVPGMRYQVWVNGVTTEVVMPDDEWTPANALRAKPREDTPLTQK